MLSMTGIIWFWVITGIVAIIGALIHSFIENCGFFDLEDFFDAFFDDFGWAVFLGILALGGVIFWCLQWISWAVLLIVLVPVIIIGIIVICIFIRKANEEEKEENERKKELKKGIYIKTNYKCPNCGGEIASCERLDREEKIVNEFVCEYCKRVFHSTKELLGSKNESTDKDLEIELSDWEEEYFAACYFMKFKPHNSHTDKQIERKYEKLSEQVYDGIYDEVSVDDEEECLENAFNFFNDELDNIQKYVENNDEELIKKKFDYFLENIDDYIQ